MKSEYPSLVIENCASGALRKDLATQQYFDCAFLSDNVDPFESIKMFQGAILRTIPGRISKWADDNNKTVHGLLNSGCLNFCSNQTFHDNLVSHESELTDSTPLPGFHPVICHKFYADPENAAKFREYGNWIHPADLAMYDDIYATGKLATRMTNDVEKVISAYTQRSFDGNPAELLEPRFESLI